MIKKMVSKWLSLATASILGQPPLDGLKMRRAYFNQVQTELHPSHRGLNPVNSARAKKTRAVSGRQVSTSILTGFQQSVALPYRLLF
jgi:hypothetical protein